MANNDSQSGAAAGRPLFTCPECGFLFAGQRCPLCGRAITASDAPSRPPPVEGQHHGRGAKTFGLSTLFLVVTLVAVLLGVGLAAPGLAVLLAVIAVPALVRASASAAKEQAAGRPPDAFDRIGMFAGSMGVMALIMLAGFAAFFAACLGSCAVIEATGRFRGGLFGSDDSALLLINVVAGGLALLLVGWLLRKTWPRRGSR